MNTCAFLLILAAQIYADGMEGPTAFVYIRKYNDVFEEYANGELRLGSARLCIGTMPTFPASVIAQYQGFPI
ncbi:hypothetical protein COCON_G00019670 [Conger conger]|uniref:Uncharacterized protein n=1 Tax=Conger conger TaxID=82655 RepID=A0A9Q1E462_CONCO|nr:hypothetical protein COCON_G00019670 [Conger conger]